MNAPEAIKYALLSVTNKEGIVDFASALAAMGIILLSTGGTAKLLKEASIPVQEISDFTGFPEIMDGRVKTLHPKLYSGILARGERDQAVLHQHSFPRIGLVVVNLYPFEKIAALETARLEEVIEHIDIGGPTLLRAAAKNFHYTAAVVSSEDYGAVIAELKQYGQIKLETRLALAKKVFSHVARYDAAISNYFSALADNKKLEFPETLTVQLQKKSTLRYGENPHQHAAFYTTTEQQTGNISHAIQHSGKPLSYNNIADADCALECVKQFKDNACVIVKHSNPCACALGKTQIEAYQKAYSADSVSAFGGIIAFNTELEAETLVKILDNQFVEVIVAPNIPQEAIEKAQHKPNVRLLSVGEFPENPPKIWQFASVNGGLLMQEQDNLPSPPHTKIVTHRHPTMQEMVNLLFAWHVIRFVKSNAILFASNKLTLGIGPGQMSRLFSLKIAAIKAKEAGFSLKSAVMASDAFLPFSDTVEEAHTLGISAIIQPGGSIRDEEVIKLADAYDMAMIFTNRRHFRH
jgi:phosphoribosylaminoimidazolecarboxamide formyltransferase/IMP cyclohydrolase